MKIRLIATAIVAVLIAGTPAQAAVGSLAAIERQKSDLRAKIRQAEARAKGIASQIAVSDARRLGLQRDLESLSNRLGAAQGAIEDLEGQLEQSRGDLFLSEQHLEQTQSQLTSAGEALERRARVAYQVGPGAFIETLLEAESARDFISRITLLSGVLSEDRERLISVRELTIQANSQRDEMRAKQEQMTQTMAALQMRRGELASVSKKRQTAIEQVKQEMGRQNDLLVAVKSDKQQYEAMMRRLAAESRSIASMLRSRSSGPSMLAGAGKAGGSLKWPTTGSISSPFGMRTHPVFGDRRMHTGVDITAAMGQPVMSAAPGQVVFAGVKGGYGVAVIVDHGGGLATLYAHLSSSGVSSGQAVGTGQQLGAAGCSGYCTGPHLHFEVRVGGEPVNPASYF